MRNELYVNFRQSEIHPRLDAIVDTLAADLGRRCASLARCKVTIDLDRMPSGREPHLSVNVELALAQHPRVVRVSSHGKPDDGIVGILREAFISATRELRRHAAIRPCGRTAPTDLSDEQRGRRVARKCRLLPLRRPAGRF